MSRTQDERRAQHHRYKEDVEERGKAFYPYVMFHDTVMSLVVVSVIVGLAAVWYFTADEGSEPLGIRGGRRAIGGKVDDREGGVPVRADQGRIGSGGEADHGVDLVVGGDALEAGGHGGLDVRRGGICPIRVAIDDQHPLLARAQAFLDERLGSLRLRAWDLPTAL